MKTESQVLAMMVDKTRYLTKYYIDKLKDTDLHKVFVADGIPLNSAFWIIAHIAVTENGLLLRCTGGDFLRIPWVKQFNVGSVPISPADSPLLDEVLSVMDEVHNRTMKHIPTLDEAFLDTINPTGFEVQGESTVRGMIIHGIRHENNHAGHLSWLCKLHGIKTM